MARSALARGARVGGRGESVVKLRGLVESVCVVVGDTSIAAEAQKGGFSRPLGCEVTGPSVLNNSGIGLSV